MYSNRHLGKNYLTTQSVCTISTDVIYLCVARITCPYRTQAYENVWKGFPRAVGNYNYAEVMGFFVGVLRNPAWLLLIEMHQQISINELC